MAKAKRDQSDSDHDGAWKEFLRRYIRAVLALYFPGLYRLIDWNHEPEWLDNASGFHAKRPAPAAGR